jgi:hypothetical protein
MEKGTEHVKATDDDAHREILRQMDSMGNGERKKWIKDMEKKFEEKSEDGQV